MARLPVARTVGIRHIHHNAGQLPRARVLQHHVFALASGLDVGPANAIPVERIVLCSGATIAERDRADGAAVHEPVEIGFGRDIEHSAQTVDVGFEQRSGISYVEAGVHHAVEHHVAVGHRRAQRFFVVEVAIAPFDIEIGDGHCQARLAEVDPHVVTAFDKLARDMGSDETTRAHHKNLAAARRVRRHDAFFAGGDE